jgi:hypothetical protein
MPRRDFPVLKRLKRGNRSSCPGYVLQVKLDLVFLILGRPQRSNACPRFSGNAPMATRSQVFCDSLEHLTGNICLYSNVIMSH